MHAYTSSARIAARGQRRMLMITHREPNATIGRIAVWCTKSLFGDLRACKGCVFLGHLCFSFGKRVKFVSFPFLFPIHANEEKTLYGGAAHGPAHASVCLGCVLGCARPFLIADG